MAHIVVGAGSVAADITLIRLKKVMEKTGLCRSSVYALPGFPKPVKLGGGRAAAWVRAEVDEWINKTIAASRGSVA